MYTFKMQTVLDHRQFIEDNLKKEHAEIRQQVMAAQQQMESLKRKETDTTTALKREQAKGISSDQVVAYHTYLKRLSDRLARQMTVVNEIKDQELKKQDELLEAMKKRQILEKLKDQDLERYRQMMLKKEMNFIDEIAVNQFVRKTIEKSGEGQ
ncbi:flagellar export protein FliJ [uncultured Desulfosarcina sp.]|uniref:flagellar export protein FliJ n=1 Tax=uncultured Desulfosarcina sp. TaxID=218289 RepID=UPI0029C85328|nr:flagellar export protein FliJ [uncultured Desulfosarcina sp.]